ncbi:hypothetical protein JXB27_04240 [Candidatus Woesearchaeota archaeon]|nr:hypothetical protein [Candidatus Woesearchaeota archaeon]
MKQAFSLLIVLMFVLSAVPIALAQDTEASVTDVTGITAVTDETTEETVEAETTATEEPAETEEETTESVVEDDTVTAVVTSAETGTAEEPAEGVEIESTEEYSGIEQLVDNVKLAFTWNEQVKLNLMAKIQAKRDAHAAFLESKGKTEQANRFREGTTKLVQKFDGQRVKMQEKAVAREAKKQASDNVTALKEKVRERITEKISEKGKVRNEESSSEETEDTEEVETESEDVEETPGAEAQKGKN